MKRDKGKHWKVALGYAEGIRDGTIVANLERKQCVERFFRDLENPEYEMDSKGPEFCIGIIEKTLCHQQGEALDGTPMRGKPFELQPWQMFCVYNIVGFHLAGTDIVRFHEALIFIPRKNSKTSFAASLAWALSLWYRKSGAKCYVASAALMQSLETFNFLKYNTASATETCIIIMLLSTFHTKHSYLSLLSSVTERPCDAKKEKNSFYRIFLNL
mgnify:CR=1 FL=1